MAGPGGGALLIAEWADGVRLRAVGREGEGRGLVHRPAIDGEAWNLGEPRRCIVAQLLLPSGNTLAADAFDVVDRGAEADHLGDGRRARLEAIRRLAERRAGERDVSDHV